MVDEPVYRTSVNLSEESNKLLDLIMVKCQWTKRMAIEEAIKLLAATLAKGEGEE